MILSKQRSFNPCATLCVLIKWIVWPRFANFSESPEAWQLESGRTCRETEPSLCSSRYDWAIVAKAMFHFSPVGKGNKQSSRLTLVPLAEYTGCFAVHSYTGQSTQRVFFPSTQNMTQKLVYSKSIYTTAANNISYCFKGIQQRKKILW